MVLLSFLFLTAGAGLAQTDNLIITEYVEGSVNNKALEIFNGTGDLIALGSYSIERYSNGETTGVSIPLDSVDLPTGGTWVLAHPQADPALRALADQTDSDLNFDGNDSLVLVYADDQVVDSFGRVGENPGDFWSCPAGNTQNHTLRRLSTVCGGDTSKNDEFNPCDQWTFFASNVLTGLGVHIADCGVVATDPPNWGSFKASFR